MKNLFEKLWNDDCGAIISTEMILIIGILIFGIIPGLVAMRNSINAAFGTIGNILVAIIPSFTYSGWVFASSGGGLTIAQINGYQFNPNNTYLTAGQVTPVLLPTLLVIPPAP